PRLLMDRSVEGFIAIDTALQHPLPLPVVAVAGHKKIEGVTNILLDHRMAAFVSTGASADCLHARADVQFRLRRPLEKLYGSGEGAGAGSASGAGHSTRGESFVAGVGLPGGASVTGCE